VRKQFLFFSVSTNNNNNNNNNNDDEEKTTQQKAITKIDMRKKGKKLKLQSEIVGKSIIHQQQQQQKAQNMQK